MGAEGVYHLFVYGSLRSGFRSPAYEYISRFFEYQSEAGVKGTLYDMGFFPAAVSSDEGHIIQGELYTIKTPSEFSWAIGQLDDYEGVNVEEHEKALYRRDVAEVYTPTGSVMAWVYWYNGDVSGKPVVSSGDVLQYLKDKQ